VPATNDGSCIVLIRARPDTGRGERVHDGGHRLAAIAEAGVPVEVMVSYLTP